MTSPYCSTSTCLSSLVLIAYLQYIYCTNFGKCSIILTFNSHQKVIWHSGLKQNWLPQHIILMERLLSAINDIEFFILQYNKLACKEKMVSLLVCRFWQTAPAQDSLIGSLFILSIILTSIKTRISVNFNCLKSTLCSPLPGCYFVSDLSNQCLKCIW